MTVKTYDPQKFVPRVGAKYATPTNQYSNDQHSGGEVISRNPESSQRIQTDLSRGLRDIVKGLFTGDTVKRVTDPSALQVNFVYAAHDVHGLREHGKEADGFQTKRTIRRSVELRFDSAQDANRAHNAILNLDDDELKTAMFKENLEDVIADKLGLKVENAKNMHRIPPVLLFPAHFMAS